MMKWHSVNEWGNVKVSDVVAWCELPDKRIKGS